MILKIYKGLKQEKLDFILPKIELHLIKYDMKINLNNIQKYCNKNLKKSLLKMV